MNYTKSVIEEQEKNIVEAENDDVTQAEKEAFLNEMSAVTLMQNLEQAQAKIAELEKKLDAAQVKNVLYEQALLESQCANFDLRYQLTILRNEKIKAANAKAVKVGGGFLEIIE